MSAFEAFYYNDQLRKYIVQISAVFAGMKVSIGADEDDGDRLISVPIKYASVDRVVGAIKGDNTQNKPLRLPIMSMVLSSIAMAPEKYKGIGTVRRNTMVPTGGLVPDDVKVIEQRMPVPYTADWEVSMFVSNQNQHFQIIEQILSLFNPSIQLQTSDDIFDHTRVTQLELINIAFEENLPQGVDRRTIKTTLTFQCTVYISIPAIEHKRFIEEIYIRIGALNNTDAATNYEILADLDSQGIEYEKVFDSDDLNFE